MKRHCISSRHQLRRGQAAARRVPQSRGARELPPPATRPAILAGVALTISLCLAALWMSSPAETPRDARSATTMGRDSMQAGARPSISAPRARAAARERAPSLIAPHQLESKASPDAEVDVAFPELPIAEPSSPPNSVDSEMAWQNEGHVGDTGDGSTEPDPEAAAVGFDRFDEIGEIELDLEDDDEHLDAKRGAFEQREEALREEIDEDFRGQDDLAGQEQILDEEAALQAPPEP